MFKATISMVLTLLSIAAACAETVRTQSNVPAEIAFSAKQPHDDPFNKVMLDVVFTDPAGKTFKVPAFWAGAEKWKVRYASPLIGAHRWRSESNDANDAGLHGVEGSVEISTYTGDNPMFKHGPIRVAADKRHLEHADGTPFFWLGDTWWMGLCHRIHFPDEFGTLAADRKAKGFNVIQLVAGLYPDMHPFDPRGANEAGFPWEKEYARIRPEYFDAADKRIQFLVDQGFSPCIVGAWGYFLPWMGVEKANKHWRYLIARYGAMPVTWCVAGEANLPWYLAKGFPYDDRELVHGWTDVARYVRAADPFHRLTTIHPTGMGPLNARSAIDDVSLLDYDMLQTPHGQRSAVGPTVKAAVNSYNSTPEMPMLNGEASYEMLSDTIPADWPRAMFWLCMLNGACGHTYGANGIWQCNRRGEPHGKSPHGGTYGKIPWDEAMNLAGSKQIGFGKKFLMEFPWTQIVPMRETVKWADGKGVTKWGDWIWYPEGDPTKDAPVEARYFRRVVDIPETLSFEIKPKFFDVCPVRIDQAVFNAPCDDKFTLWINGEKEEIGSSSSWETPAHYNVARFLRTGKNVLAVRAENLPAPVKQNPAGFLSSLRVRTKVLTRVKKELDRDFEFKSDDAWRVSKTESDGWRNIDFDDSKWEKAKVIAKYGEGPWKRLEKDDQNFAPNAAGISDKLRIVYALEANAVAVSGLKANAKYKLTRLDAVTGTRSSESATSDGEGKFVCQPPQEKHDWVFVVEAE